MLRLLELRVLNFRSIRRQVFPFQALTVLIGKNNAGKSNVLDGVITLLEGTRRNVTVDEFFDPGKDFVLEGRFAGIRDFLHLVDQKNRPRVEERVDAQGCITIRRVGNVADHTLSDVQILAQDGQTSNTPTGIGAALKPALPEICDVKPLADVADEITSKTTSSLGKLLMQITDQVEGEAQPLLEKAYSEADKLLNVPADALDLTEQQDGRVEPLKGIEGRLTGYLQETFPKSRVRLRIGMPTVKQVLGNIEVLVHDGSLWKPFYRQGHGIQRALLLSLLRALAFELRRRPESKVKRPFMLLIDEPELFLYPSAQEQMRDALQTISQSNQVIFSTHSPLLVSPVQLPGLLRLHKTTDEQSGREETKLVGTIPAKSLDQEKDILTMLSLQRSSQLFFAAAVVLVEGDGDRYLHRALFERLCEVNLDLEEIAMVEAGGKGRLCRLKALLRNVCPCIVALADVDYVWEGAGAELGADPDLSQLKQHCLTKAKEMLTDWHVQSGDMDRELKRAMKSCCYKNPACEPRSAVLAKLESLGTVVLSRGDIDTYVGLGEGSKGKYLLAAREVASDEREIHFAEELKEAYSKIRRLAREASATFG